MLSNAEPVIDCTIATGCKQARCLAQLACRNARYRFEIFRAVAFIGYEAGPFLIGIDFASFAHEGLVDQPFGDNHVGKGGQYRDIGSGLQREVVRCFDMRRAYQIDPSRIDDDELCPFTQTSLHAAGKDRVRIGRIRSDNENDVAMLDGIEVLSSCAGTECCLQSVTGR